MVTSVKTLKTQIDSRLAGGGLTALGCCQLQGACNILQTQVVVSVATCTSLPDVSLNEGRLVYVTDIQQYRISDGSSWTANLTSTSSRTAAGFVLGWGSNNCGQLGDNTFTSRSFPVREGSSSTTWCTIGVGKTRTTAGLKTNGTLWAWGINSFGQLGNPNFSFAISPVQEICSSTNWCNLAVGATTVGAVKTDGTLWLWGNGYCGQLANGRCGGFGNFVASASPQQEICSATNWCQLTLGFFAGLALKKDGSIWGWGRNFCGMIGDNTVATRLSPVREITSSTTWCQVASGYAHTVAIKTDGSLWAWGMASCGNLGDNTTVDKSSAVREISSSTTWCQACAGLWHTLAVKNDGTLWAWGRGICGVLGRSNVTNFSSAVREITNSTNWCQASAYVSSAAVKTDGSLWTWGPNAGGQLGDGTTADKSSPVREISNSSNWCMVSTGLCNTAALGVFQKGF